MHGIAGVIGVCAAAALAAGCASSTSGHAPSGAVQPPQSSAGSSPVPGNAGPLSGAQFARVTTAAAEHAQTVKIEERTSFLGEPLSGTGALRFAAGAADATFAVHSNGLDVQIVMAGGDVYVKGFGSATPGKPWRKSDPADAADMTAMLKAADPRHTVRMLAAVGTMRPVGQETMNGVPAAHYSVKVDMAKVAQQVPELASEARVAMKAGVQVEYVQVWVGADQLPVRLMTSASVPGNGGKKKVTSQITDYSDWGKPVDIQAPPPDQVGAS